MNRRRTRRQRRLKDRMKSRQARPEERSPERSRRRSGKSPKEDEEIGTREGKEEKGGRVAGSRTARRTKGNRAAIAKATRAPGPGRTRVRRRGGGRSWRSEGRRGQRGGGRGSRASSLPRRRKVLRGSSRGLTRIPGSLPSLRRALPGFARGLSLTSLPSRRRVLLVWSRTAERGAFTYSLRRCAAFLPRSWEGKNCPVADCGDSVVNCVEVVSAAGEQEALSPRPWSRVKRGKPIVAPPSKDHCPPRDGKCLEWQNKACCCPSTLCKVFFFNEQEVMRERGPLCPTIVRTCSYVSFLPSSLSSKSHSA